MDKQKIVVGQKAPLPFSSQRLSYFWDEEKENKEIQNFKSSIDPATIGPGKFIPSLTGSLPFPNLSTSARRNLKTISRFLWAFAGEIRYHQLEEQQVRFLLHLRTMPKKLSFELLLY